METKQAILALSALAQESRLAIFRLLIRHGPVGIAAGAIGEELNLPAATLSFHLAGLVRAGLAQSRQEGRFIFYSANFENMNALVAFLTENCCCAVSCELAQCQPAATAKGDQDETPSRARRRA